MLLRYLDFEDYLRHVSGQIGLLEYLLRRLKKIKLKLKFQYYIIFGGVGPHRSQETSQVRMKWFPSWL